jgi:hypothetical protein
MRCAVDQDALLLEDLVDDPEVPASRRIETLELATKRPIRPLTVDGDRIEDRGDGVRTFPGN